MKVNCTCTDTKGCSAHYLVQSIRENSTEARELGGYDFAERLSRIAEEMEAELNGFIYSELGNG